MFKLPLLAHIFNVSVLAPAFELQQKLNVARLLGGNMAEAEQSVLLVTPAK